ncbi:MAG: WD40 repeat domain-containing protein [SAR324 cluster bacterium]|nr:WD40 repeat domain-containing protein [SAR324 cluster bacterium]
MKRLTLLLFIIALSLAPTSLLAKDEYIVHRTYNTSKGDLLAGGISKDGRYAYAIDKKFAIKIWRYNTGRTMKLINTGKHKPYVAVFHPSKPILFTGGADGNVFIWDIIKGVKIQQLSGHTTKIDAIAISNSGQFLVTGGKERNIILWRLDRYKIFKKILEPTRKVVALDFHPDNKTIAWANATNEVKIWATDKDSLVASHKKHKKKVTHLKFHPSGNLLGSAGFGNKVILYNIKRKAIQKVYKGHEKAISAIDFTSDGKELLTCSLDGTIKLWKVRSGKINQNFKLVEKAVKYCEFSSDTRKIIAVFTKSYIRGWNLGESGHMKSFLGHKKGVIDIGISRTGAALGSVGQGGQIFLWNLASKKKIKSIDAGSHKPQAIAISPDNQTFATGGSDSEIRIWDKKTFKIIKTLTGGHRGKINSLAYHPTEPVLISAGADKKVIHWNLTTGKLSYEKEVHQGQIYKVIFNNDGEYYLTASQDKTVKYWRFYDHQLMQTFKGHKRGVRAIAFSNGKDIIASGSDDKMIKLWDLGSGNLLKTLIGHDFIVSGLEFSPNGKALLSASRDKTLRLWDAERGVFIQTLSGQNDQVTSVAVSPDGKLLASATLGNEINLIKLPKDIFWQPKRAVGEEAEGVGTVDGAPYAARGSTAVNRDNIKDRAKKKKGIAEKDIIEEEIVDQRDNVFDPPLVVVDQDLMALKKGLNNILKKGDSCANERELADIAMSILAKTPDDMVAYYALIQSYTVRQNLQMVFFASKLGVQAKFYPKYYDFSDGQTLRTAIAYWSNQVFSHPENKPGGEVAIEVINCTNNLVDVDVPQDLLYLDLPQEIVTAVLSGKSHLDLNLFTGLVKQPSIFRTRVFSLMLAVEKNVDPINLTNIAEYEPPNISTYGYYSLDMKEIRQWGKAGGKVSFQLKHGQNEWRTFTSDEKKTRTLILLKGNYYLRVNNHVKRAFEITQNGQVMDVKVQ